MRPPLFLKELGNYKQTYKCASFHLFLEDSINGLSEGLVVKVKVGEVVVKFVVVGLKAEVVVVVARVVVVVVVVVKMEGVLVFCSGGEGGQGGGGSGDGEGGGGGGGGSGGGGGGVRGRRFLVSSRISLLARGGGLELGGGVSGRRGSL